MNKDFSNLIKTLCVYQSLFFDLKTIGRMSRVNKNWKEALERDTVKKKKNSIYQFLIISERK